MMALLDRLVGCVERWIMAARRRSRVFDRICRAWIRYSDTYATRMAAAAAYRSFFAVFALSVLTFVVLGQVFRNNPVVVNAVTRYLRNNLPQMRTDELIASSGQIGTVALIGLLFAGVGWIEDLRSSQRALWRLEQQPGHPVLRWLVDLGVLIGIGVLLAVSTAIFSGLQDLLLRLAGQDEHSPLRVALRGTNVLIAGVVDFILGAALLAGVPRIRIPRWRLIGSALLFATGLGLLKTLGKWYITRTENNPAYQLVAGTVGLLLFMYLLHQLLLFAAALAATGRQGTPVDLANRGRGGGLPRESTDNA